MPVDAAQAASLISVYREQNGLGRVGVDQRLMQVAAGQALVMGRRDRMGHRLNGGLGGRVESAGYDWGATSENLGAGYKSLEAAIEGWKASREHRDNLLNPNVSEIGVAAVSTPPGSRHRTYWALVLAGPRPEPGSAGPFGQ